MAILTIVWAKRLSKAGSVLGRQGLSQRAAEIMVELVTKTGSYKAGSAGGIFYYLTDWHLLCPQVNTTPERDNA